MSLFSPHQHHTSAHAPVASHVKKFARLSRASKLKYFCLPRPQATRTHVQSDAPGGKPHALCVGHSEKLLLDSLFETVAATEHFLDIASLCFPDGRFKQALANGLSFLHSKDKEITVRMLFAKADYGEIKRAQLEGRPMLRNVLCKAQEGRGDSPFLDEILYKAGLVTKVNDQVAKVKPTKLKIYVGMVHPVFCDF